MREIKGVLAEFELNLDSNSAYSLLYFSQKHFLWDWSTRIRLIWMLFILKLSLKKSKTCRKIVIMKKKLKIIFLLWNLNIVCINIMFKNLISEMDINPNMFFYFSVCLPVNDWSIVPYLNAISWWNVHFTSWPAILL